MGKCPNLDISGGALDTIAAIKKRGGDHYNQRESGEDFAVSEKCPLIKKGSIL